MPSFPRPTSRFSFSDFGLPTASSDGTLPTSIQATPIGATAVPTSTSSIGLNCTPQGNGGGNAENGVKNKNCCTNVTMIFARGTGELGNVGTVSGPPMFKSLRQKLGADRVTVQGMDYPASAAGNANLGRDGGPTMAQLAKTALSQCPFTKIILGGYSQGAMVVHNAFSQGVSSTEISGAVLFGDPSIRMSIGDLDPSKVKEFCASADNVCGSPTGNVSGSHLSYGTAADAAADFVIQAAGLA
ncbi:cutinase-domain-containing protein [Lojkania enalia]|uniref:Cutinase n=1 Tax=Lojkania enalia TaxID=147567 RepID=A0A9P4TRN0_9PLEO|nr:cutinase-domain-containing protein [Didymosphaeria enalia]